MKKLKILSSIVLFSMVSNIVFSVTPEQITTVSDTAAISYHQDNSSREKPNAQVAMSVPYYPVTAGDIYTLSFAIGTTPVTYTIPIDSTYKVRVANMGVISCQGLSYLQLKSQVESLVLRNYPMSGVQFVLTAPSVFTVTISGEVDKTEEHNVWALTRLSYVALKSFAKYSSSRDILIENEKGETKSYDLFKFMRMGDLAQDPFLRPGDKIKIQRANKIVYINGAVERPGKYQLLEGENLKELVEFYGNGLEQMADTSRIELTRKTGEDASGVKVYLDENAISSNLKLENFDSVYINSFEDLKPVLFVEGAVKAEVDTELQASNRIPFNFIKGEDYAFFTRRHKSIFTSSSDLANAYIIRQDQILPVDLTPMLYDTEFHTMITIKQGDVLVIPFKQFFISVAGSVYKPGRYPYIPDRNWEYYIGLAGGFKKAENSHEMIEIIDINGKKLSKKDPITPECTITAKTNGFLYYFNQYAPLITTTLSVVVSAITIGTYIDSKK